MVESQAYLFLVFTLTGIAIGILFDLFRVLRKSFKTSDIITYLQDILFWILTGTLILYNIWYFNDGEIRLFMFLGIIIGILIYILILSNFFMKIFLNIFKIIKKALKLFELPFKPIIYFFKKIYSEINKFLVKNVKKLINLKNKSRNLEKNGE